MSTFWDFFWLLFWGFVWVSYLFAVITVIVDIFRDHTLAGGWKALWIIFLVFLPFLTVLVYVIARGQGMSERMRSRGGTAPEDDSYKPAASSNPTEDIAKAHALLEQGVISQGEFDALKSKALTGRY